MATAALELSELLDRCDRVLGEAGRRRHLFAWLRAPDGGAEEWLPVDAYYPSHRLVVVWREQPGEHDAVYAQQVPAHGLRLLALSPHALGDDPGAALRQMIAALAPVASPARPPEPVVQRHADGPRRAGGPPVRYGFWLALALAMALFIELYLGVARGALDHGRVVLAFALAIDGCARTLGAVAARRAGAPDWAWGCAILGSPAVAFFWRSEQATAEPAPLAGLLAIVALVALVLALLIG
jgi:hypothetical protein